MSLRPQPPSPPAGSAPPAARALRAGLDDLRAELADLAFALERRHRFDAADMVMIIANRIDALCATDAATVPASAPERSPVRDDTSRSW